MAQNYNIMDEQLFGEFSKGIANGTYKSYNFYDLVDPTIHAYYNINKAFKFSSKPKKLPLKFFDIEVDADESEFPEPSKAEYPVNAIAIYDNIDNELYSLIVPPANSDKNINWQQEIETMYHQVVKENPKYEVPDIKIKVTSFKDDLSLLTRFYDIVNNSSSIALAGYNSGLFDIPYIFNRLKKLTPNWQTIASNYGQVKGFKNNFTVPDIIYVDMLYLYKPQSAGGAAMGKARVSYSLDYVSKSEIGIGKLEYEGNLVNLYKEDPVKFFVYNIFDTTLLHLLNEKLNHVNVLYGLSKFAGAPMSKTLMGRSLLYQFNKTMSYWDNGTSVRSKLYNEEFIMFK